MKLTTNGKFAVDALLDIAIYSKNSPVSLNDISIRQNISVSYLEQLFVKLRKSGLVKSHKGPGGGYTLARANNLINIAEIVKSVEDDLDARSCHGMKNCREQGQCLAHNLWSNLTTYVFEHLQKISLDDVSKMATTSVKKIAFHPQKNKSIAIS